MNFEKRTSVYKIVMAVIVTAIITFMGTTIFMYNYYLKTDKGISTAISKAEPVDLDDKLGLIKVYIKKYYLGEINEDDMIESAIKGYVAGLGDEYTEFLTKDEYEELMVDVNGNYVGIGIYMAQDRDGNVVVLLPIEGSPAEEEGLKTGDIVVKVDGEDVTGMDLSLVAKKIKGEEGSTVDLEIKREEEIINKQIKRRKVEIKSIETKILDDNIGYIQIFSFDDGVNDKFKEDLEDLQNKGVKNLIVDVRDNGGGIVTEATNIADLFLEKNSNIMIQIDKDNNEEIVKAKDDKKVKSDMNVIVLINENSASASEILVGALKDNNAAEVVGERTYGKGVMQEIVPVSAGGALKLTIREFRTPNGERINKEGIKPDVEIKDDKNTKEDEQLQRAIEECKR